jgi:voltage-gated potassium channel
VEKFKAYCQEFFYGTGEAGVRGQYIMLGVDTTIVLYFVITTFIPNDSWTSTIDVIIGIMLAVELTLRFIADSDRVGLLSKPLALLDVAIILSLFLPKLAPNFAFLRVVRAMRVIRSYAVVRQLKLRVAFFGRNEEVIFSALNLLVFIFVITAFVYVLQVGEEGSDIRNYIDALYFTVTTLTTTGFGDVILVGNKGRLLAIVIMIVGVALFIRLVQTLFRPNKIRYECPRCGLMRHELDAVYCKHCGDELHIRTEGMT